MQNRYISKSDFPLLFQDLAESRPTNSPVQVSRTAHENFTVVCYEDSIYFDIILRPEEYRFFSDIEKYCFAKNFGYDLIFEENDFTTAGITVGRNYRTASEVLEYLFELVYGVSDQYLFQLDYVTDTKTNYTHRDSDDDLLLLENPLPEEDPSLLNEKRGIIKSRISTYFGVGIVTAVSLAAAAVWVLFMM